MRHAGRRRHDGSSFPLMPTLPRILGRVLFLPRQHALLGLLLDGLAQLQRQRRPVQVATVGT